ncbi:NnrS family protein [bacterium]|nr:NnrS family protein [bacterium]MBU1957642.1 NnrS family protein [bacterium]
MVDFNRVKNHFFLSQPHQPFFVLAFINAFVSMFLFMLMFKGIVATEITGINYHAYSLIFLMFTPAFLAFLFTTFPRFSATDPIPQEHYLQVLGLFLAGFILFQIGTFVSISLASVGMLLTLLGHLGAGHILLGIYKASNVTDKEDQQWILIAMAFGLVAHVLFVVSMLFPVLHTLSVQIAIYLYLFLLTFTIAQRMVPFFSHSPIEKHVERFKVIVGLLALRILLEVFETHSSFLVDLLLAYLIGKELYRWKLPFPNSNPLVWVLHIALFWIPITFFLSAVTNILTLSYGMNFLYLDIHTLLLGFLLTILIGFGTRVTLGHSGNMMLADRLTTILFYWTQVVVVMRILTSIAVANGWKFFVFFDLSITVWFVLFGFWARRFFPVLIFGKKLDKKSD